MPNLWLYLDTLQLLLAVYALVCAVTGLVMLYLNFTNIRLLRDVSITEPANWPKVSLIAPARNEERNIEEAMRSLLALDYPNLQMTIVNDRSTDRTGEILQRLAREHARLNVVEITELPAGWLGKNHALHVGAHMSDGEWLLFTDADIIFSPTVLKQALSYSTQHQLQHLSAFPDLRMPSKFLTAVVVTFAKMLILFIRPWQVRNPRRTAYMGVGAFNLVRADAYHAVGGHVAIRMRPDDDLKLGHLLKKGGYASDVVSGIGTVCVEWYASLGEMIRGLEKNSAAPMEYSSAKVLGACGVLLAAYIWPFLAVWLTSGWTQCLFASAVVLLLLANTYMAYQVKQPLWMGLLFPITIAIFIYIQLRSLLLLWWHGGIHWRGTHYAVAELTANRI
jgi:glycosyltransferase involved in cell wall biosynthesis